MVFSTKYPFMDRMFMDKEQKTLSQSWLDYFRSLYGSINTNEHFEADRLTVQGAVTGDLITAIPVADFRAAAIFYAARYQSNQRAGLIMGSWLADGTLASAPFQMDVVDIGDCSDLSFSFTYDGSTFVRLILACSHAYDVGIVRIAI